MTALLHYNTKKQICILPLQLYNLMNYSPPTGFKQPTVQPANSRIIIAEQYLLKRLIKRHPCFNLYEGIDLQASKFVHAYVKHSNIEFGFSKRIKEELRAKVAPGVLWIGTHKIQKVLYNVEIHEKYGPSLKSMFSYVRDPICEKDFLLLMYQLVRLIEKYGSVGYVFRQLDMDHIVFDSKPERSELFLLNVFALRKKGEEAAVLNTKFCSRGSHLGLQANIKDDLEAICYILLYIHSRNFLANIPGEDYISAKTNLSINSFKRPLPNLFIDFYNYVIGLNYSDEVNYFHWRNTLYKVIGKDTLVKPFGWMIAKDSSEEGSIRNSTSQSFHFGEEEETVDIEDQMRPMDQENLKKIASKQLVLKRFN